jgi:hypothetical protein
MVAYKSYEPTFDEIIEGNERALARMEKRINDLQAKIDATPKGNTYTLKELRFKLDNITRQYEHARKSFEGFKASLD